MQIKSQSCHTCLFCQSEADFLFDAYDYNRDTDKTPFNYYCCPKCKLIFLSPIPEDLSRYYMEDYHWVPSSKAELAKTAPSEKFKIEIIRKFIKHGRLLEIGPSVGAFAFLAKEAGFDVEALEMDSRCCKFLREELEIPTMESSDIEQSLLTTKPYDIIALWQVIEHLPDPFKSLKAIVDSIKPGGFLVLAAPNPEAFQFKIFKSRWTHLDAPRHVTLLPIQLLDGYLKKMSMISVLSITNDEGSLHWNAFGWKFSLENLSKKPSVKRVLFKVSKALSKLFDPLEKRNRLGSTYTLVYKKEVTN